MFWLGELIALIAGLVGIALIRGRIRRRLSRVAESHLDILLVGLLLAGLITSAAVHVREVAKGTQLERDIAAVRDYSSVARLGPRGVTGTAGSGLKETSPLSKALEGTWVERDGRSFPLCNDAALAKFDAVTGSHPRFPFSHYALAVCLRGREAPPWRRHAAEAVRIFEHTTAIAGHHPGHDGALAELRGYIEQARDAA